MKDIKIALTYIFLIMGIFVVVGPFVYMFITSLTGDNFSLPSPHKLLVDAKSFDNYVMAWSKNHFQSYFLNSVFVAIITVVLAISLAASTAYAFARFTFPLKELLFKAFIFTLIIPSLLSIIPQFIIIKSLGLVDTHAGLILLYVGSGVVGRTFFLRGFFERIPVEL